LDAKNATATMTTTAKNQSMNRPIARTTVPLTGTSLTKGIVGRS
jgi:hypothetical protein